MARRPYFSRILASAVVALVIVLAITIWRSWSHGDPAPPPPPCPAGMLDEPSRREALIARLASVESGAELATHARDLRFCFGAVSASMLSGTRVLLLDTAQDDAELAARVGHLVVHSENLPFPTEVPPGARCDRLVAEALVREAHAYAVELELLRALGAPSGRYEFESAFWAAPQGEREEIVRRYLEEHPRGGPGLDALADGYRARCEHEQAHR